MNKVIDRFPIFVHKKIRILSNLTDHDHTFYTIQRLNDKDVWETWDDETKSFVSGPGAKSSGYDTYKRAQEVFNGLMLVGAIELV